LTNRNTAFYSLYFTAKFEQSSFTLPEIEVCNILKTPFDDLQAAKARICKIAMSGQLLKFFKLLNLSIISLEPQANLSETLLLLTVVYIAYAS